MPAPPRVDDIERYWTTKPPQISPRAMWWMERIAGGWRPNKRVRSMGYDEASAYYGVYIWEYLELIFDAVRVPRDV